MSTVATIPILFTAVQPWIWSFYTVCIFAAFLLALLQKQEGGIWIESKISISLVGLFLFVTIFQCLPLLFSVLSVLSPFRFEVLSQVNTILDNPNSWYPLSYAAFSSFVWWIYDRFEKICAFSRSEFGIFDLTLSPAKSGKRFSRVSTLRRG